MKKLHPNAVWIFFFRGIIGWVLIGGYIALQLSYMINEELLVTLFIIFFLVIMIISFLAAKLTYHFYKYNLTENEYKAERGIIWKRYISIPYERIQNVDIYRGILDRLFGLSDLQIHTAGYGAAGGMSKRGSEGRLPGIGREEAELVREKLIKRARGFKQ